MRMIVFLFSLLYLPIHALLVKPAIVYYLYLFSFPASYSPYIELLTMFVMGLLIFVIIINWEGFRKATVTLVITTLSFGFIVVTYYGFVANLFRFYTDIHMSYAMLALYASLLAHSVWIRRKRKPTV
jgi:hypothetical protein